MPAYNFYLRSLSISRSVKHITLADTHTSTRESQTIDLSTIPAPLRLFALNAKSSPQTVSQLRLGTALDTHSYPLHYLRVFAACAVTQIELHSLSVGSISATLNPRMLSTQTYHTRQRTRYFLVSLLELSRFIFFSVTEQSHSPHYTGPKESQTATCLSTNLGQLVFSY